MAPLRDISELALNIRTPDAVPETSMRTSPPTRESLTTEGGFLEAWAQGYNVGSLIVLILIVFCNYRSGIWLHKLILLELVLALGHGTFIFVKDPWYGWYLSATASLLFISYFLHNVVSWLKLRPFLPLWGSRTFIITLLCVQPFWVAEAWSNFSYFNQLGSDANVRLRPWEALLRDPWWIFTTWKLLDAIKKTYGFKLWALVKINRRFGVMLMCMFISIAFLLTDVAVSAARVSASSGINPYWRFALVFKCASDTIFLDDFKSVLDDIVARKFSSTGDTVHRRSAALPHHRHARKRSRSTSRGEDFIECRSLDGGDPRSASLATIRPPQSAIDRTSKLKKLFTRSKPPQRDTLQVPQIQVQQDYIVTSQAREPSQGSRDSADAMLSRPEHAVYNSRQKRASESDASLLIGRLV